MRFRPRGQTGLQGLMRHGVLLEHITDAVFEVFLAESLAGRFGGGKWNLISQMQRSTASGQKLYVM